MFTSKYMETSTQVTLNTGLPHFLKIWYSLHWRGPFNTMPKGGVRIRKTNPPTDWIAADNLACTLKKAKAPVLKSPRCDMQDLMCLNRWDVALR